MDKIVKSGNCVSTTFPHYFKSDISIANPELVTKNFKMLDKCIKKKKCAEIKYQSLGTGDITERKVNPYYMVWGIGETCLRAWCHLRKDVRTFVLDGMLEIKISYESFRMPDNLNPEKEIQDGFGLFFGDTEDVVIRFNPEVEHLVRRKIWHPSQSLKKNKDGSLTLEMKVSSYEPLISWILGWGDKAILLKPEPLRKEIFSTMKDARHLYGEC